MISILVCCANGSGTSLMMKMTLDKVIKSLDVKTSKVHHCSISEGKNTSLAYDVVFCPLNFVDMFKEAKEKGVHIIGIKNVMSQKEMEDKLIETGLNYK